MRLARVRSLPVGILLSSLLGFLSPANSQRHSQQVYLQDAPSPFSRNEDTFEADVDPHAETDNLIFTTIASLLQQWPNTRFRNGHTIVRGTIPVGTIL
jgi:hypothetical protein